jgi:hypothetical protein
MPTILVLRVCELVTYLKVLLLVLLLWKLSRSRIRHALSQRYTHKTVMNAMKTSYLGNHIVVERNMSTVSCQLFQKEVKQFWKENLADEADGNLEPFATLAMEALALMCLEKNDKLDWLHEQRLYQEMSNCIQVEEQMT